MKRNGRKILLSLYFSVGKIYEHTLKKNNHKGKKKGTHILYFTIKVRIYKVHDPARILYTVRNFFYKCIKARTDILNGYFMLCLQK
jgi:hypothetical protein